MYMVRFVVEDVGLCQVLHKRADRFSVCLFVFKGSKQMLGLCRCGNQLLREPFQMPAGSGHLFALVEHK